MHLRVDKINNNRINGSTKHQLIRAANHKSIISYLTCKTSEVKTKQLRIQKKKRKGKTQIENQ